MPENPPLIQGSARIVWGVWTESGEYEQWSRDLRGLFATRELAEEHAAQLGASRAYNEVEVAEEEVLDAAPASVPNIRWSAHITPDGQEDRGLGFNRGEQYKTWSNEITAAHGRLDRWSTRGADLYIEVVGSDREAVKSEYERLLALARARLSEGAAG